MPRSVVPVLLPGDPTLALHATTKQYVDRVSGLGGWVDCSSLTTAADINAAIQAAPTGSTIWLGRKTSAALEVEDTIVLKPGMNYLGGGGRGQMTKIVTGSSFPAGKPVLAAQGYMNSATSCDNPIRVVGLNINVNNKAGSHGLVVYNFWSHFEDIQVQNVSGSTARGIMCTDRGYDGSTLTNNSHSENTFVRCRFFDHSNKAIAFFAESRNGGSNQDGHLLDCFFSGITGDGIRIGRSAGWSIENNHLYGIGYNAIVLGKCYATKVLRNYIEDFGGDNGANNGSAPTYGYYSGISLEEVLNTRACVVANNTVSISVPAAPAGNQYTCYYVRAGSGQSLANVVMTGNTAVWASTTVSNPNRSHAFRLGEPGDSGRMLYVEWAGNQIQSALAWAVTRYVHPTTVTLTEPSTVPASRQIATGSGLQGGGDLTADRTLSVVFGSAAGTAVEGNDARMSNSRVPVNHGSTHGIGGTDPVTPAMIGALLQLTPTATRTTSVTASPGEYVIVDASGGPITITSPASGTFGVKKIDTSANVVTVAAGSGQTIGSAGATSIPIRTQDQSGVYQLNGTNWLIERSHLSLAQLDSRYDLRYAPLAHSHAASDIISGVLDIARLPTGTSGTTVALGNDSRFTDARTPTAHASSHLPGGSDAIAALVPTGGTTGQVLAKSSASDYALAWVTPSTGGGAPAAHASTHLPGGSDEIYSPVRTVTAAYTVVDTDCVVLGNTNSAGFTITLPTAVGRTGKRFVIKKPGANTANPLSIASNGGTIDGATTETISVAGGFRELVSDGTNWHIVSGKVEPVIISLGSFGSGSTIAIDASIGNVYRATASGNITLGVPTNPVDGDVVEVQILTSAALTITINSSILLAGGANASLAMASGKRWFGALRFVTGVGWFLVGSAAQA